MSWRDFSPIRSIQKMSRSALQVVKRVAKPPLRAVIVRSRSALVSLAHRSPWLHAKLRRYRYFDHRMRMLFGTHTNTPASSASIRPRDDAPSLPPVWRRKGHNDACKTPLESWFNR